MEENNEEKGEKKEEKRWRCVYLHHAENMWTSSLMELGCSCPCFHFLVEVECQPLFWSTMLCFWQQQDHKQASFTHISLEKVQILLWTCDFYFKSLLQWSWSFA